MTKPTVQEVERHLGALEREGIVSPLTHPDISGTPRSLAEVVSIFRRHLLLPDLSVLYVALGAVAANRLPGDPVWPVIVGPPGDGKTEILRSLTSLPDVHMTGTLTEASLLSGTSKREQASSAKGGLLKEIGPFGIIVAKDLTSVLSMQRDARAVVLAALREVYDGMWTRHVGTDGGKVLSWAGKVGLLAGCTPVIDRHHGFMAAMGERFLLVRTPHVPAEAQARRALSHAGHEDRIRRELTEAVGGLFLTASRREPRGLSEHERDLLVSIVTLVVRARSAVERDGHSREVELVPPPEAPTRLIKVLDRLLAGLDQLGLARDEAWAVVARAALDSIPRLRLQMMRTLYETDGSVATSRVAEQMSLPTQTARRTLEDLAAHGLAIRTSNGRGRADTWEMSQWAVSRYVAVKVGVPEMSEGVLGIVPEMSGEAS